MLHEGTVKEEYITSSFLITSHVHLVCHSLCVICCLSIHPVIIKQSSFTIILYIPLSDYNFSNQIENSTRQSPPISRTANQTQKTKLANIRKKYVHQDRRTLRGLPVHLYHSRRRSMLSRWSPWPHYHIKRGFGRIYMPAALGYRCEALLIIYIPAFFSWLRLRQRGIHSTTPIGMPSLMSQDKDDGGIGGAGTRLLPQRMPGLRKDWGMPIGYGRMLDGYVIELGGHWQEHGQRSLGRGLPHLKLDRTHWWIFSWLFHWKHHPSARAGLAELRSQPSPLHTITLLTSTNPPKPPFPECDDETHADMTREENLISWAGHQHERYLLYVGMTLGRSSCWHGLGSGLRHLWHLQGWGWVLGKWDILWVFSLSSSFSLHPLSRIYFTHPSIVLICIMYVLSKNHHLLSDLL